MATFFCATCKHVSTSNKAGQVVSAQLAKKTLEKYGVRLTVGDRIKKYDVTIYLNNRKQLRKKKCCPYCSHCGLRPIGTDGGANTGGVEKLNEEKKTRDANQREMEIYNKNITETQKAKEQAANIQVGDFVSELATAIRFRMKLGLSEGEYLEEPERAFTDGMVFGEEQTVASHVKFQLTLTLDASPSMWEYTLANGRVMNSAGPTYIAMDRIIRKAVQDLPEGTVKYAPFIFHTQALKLPEAFVSAYVNEREGVVIRPRTPTLEQWREAQAKGQIPENAPLKDYPLSGDCTLTAPLFAAIKEWEEVDGNPDGVRLDIIITDGQLEADDVKESSQIQTARGGRLRTVLLNFAPFSSWKNTRVPDRCSQYAVTADNLNNSIRDILSEAVQDLLE